MQTICFHTRHAAERRGNRFVFELPLHRLRDPATRVNLGSVEFPMVQRTVEKAWNRFYLGGSFSMGAGDNVLRLVFRPPQSVDPMEPAQLCLPLRLNRVTRVAAEGGGAVVHFEHAHHLYSASGGCLVGAMVKMGCDVRLVACPDHDVSIALAHRDKRLAYRTSTSIFVAGVTPESVRGGWLYTSPVPSPKHLCELLTFAAQGLQLHQDQELGDCADLRFTYDHAADGVSLTLRNGKGGMLRVLPTPLSERLGLCTLAVVPDEVCYRLPVSPTREVWDFVELPCGVYAPCHRPMCAGQPMRLTNELEAAVNRFYFPLASPNDPRLQACPHTPHMVVFTDPWGATRTCPIPCGKHHPDTLCRLLEAGMVKACERDDVMFAVDHENDRFTFSCERRHGDLVEPAVFALLFHHPMSTESSRFGFAAQPLFGESSYTAPTATRNACPGGRAFTSLLRVQDQAAQKTFRFHATPIPVMHAVIRAYTEGHCIVHTFVNELPYASGLKQGDVIEVTPCTESVQTLERSDEGEWDKVEHQPSRKSAGTAVVMSTKAANPCELVLRMGGERPAVDTYVCLTPALEPWSLCFSPAMPRGMDASMLGFPPSARMWGVHGSVESHGRLVPPFDAPFVYSLDHPDYVIITLDQASSGTLDHSFGSDTRSIFCKLSLYPIFREERMLPRDAALRFGTFSRFEIAFWNPDMQRPYEFNGADFSFSLNFVTPDPRA